MRVITVNLKIQSIERIKTLVGADSLFPSRSELIRVAIRDFLAKELEVAKNIPKEIPEEIKLNSELFVNISKNERYKIISRDEKSKRMKQKNHKPLGNPFYEQKDSMVEVE